MAAVKTRRSRSSPTSSSIAASRSGTADSCCASSSWPSCSCLRSSSLCRRRRSIARCLAVAMSHAPGLSGTPVSGHFSSATTSASCARSSACPTSPMMRASPAISFADSILHTASMARCALVSVMGCNQTKVPRLCKPASCTKPDSSVDEPRRRPSRSKCRPRAARQSTGNRTSLNRSPSFMSDKNFFAQNRNRLLYSTER